MWYGKRTIDRDVTTNGKTKVRGVMRFPIKKIKDQQTPEYQTAYALDSRYYIDRFRYIGYYVGNSKRYKPL